MENVEVISEEKLTHKNLLTTAINSDLNLEKYLDFRLLLNDFYEMKKKQSEKSIRPYNYATFSAAADIKSPNYLKMIIEGKRNLSDEMIFKFAKAMSLTKEQTTEFLILTHYSQSKDPAERNLFLKELNDFRVKKKLKSGEIDKAAFEKVPDWIAWVLYSMLDQQNVSFEPGSLARLLRSKASPEEIDLSLKVLADNKKITRDAVTGKIEKVLTATESGEEIPVDLVRKLQAELMYLGLESLFQDSATEREFGSATLALTKEEFEEIRFQLRKLRKQIQKDIGVKRLASKGDRVYQLNMQLYPVTEASSQHEV